MIISGMLYAVLPNYYLCQQMKRTDKPKLMNGVKTMAGALPLAFLGPAVFYSALKNQDHPWFIPVLILGIGCMIAAVLLMFKGIRRIMDSLFD